MNKIIVEDMQNYLESSLILSRHQFGFRPGQSTMEQLLLVYEEAAACVDKGDAMYAVLLDFSKAFDVCHQVMLTRALLGLWNFHRLLGGGGGICTLPHDLGSWSPKRKTKGSVRKLAKNHFEIISVIFRLRSKLMSPGVKIQKI